MADVPALVEALQALLVAERASRVLPPLATTLEVADYRSPVDVLLWRREGSVDRGQEWSVWSGGMGSGGIRIGDGTTATDTLLDAIRFVSCRIEEHEPVDAEIAADSTSSRWDGPEAADVVTATTYPTGAAVTRGDPVQ